MWKENTQKAWFEHAHAAGVTAGWSRGLVDNWDYRLVDCDIGWYSAGLVRLSIEVPVMLGECFPENAAGHVSLRGKGKLRSGMSFCSVHGSRSFVETPLKQSCASYIVLFNKCDFHASHRNNINSTIAPIMECRMLSVNRCSRQVE